MRVHELAKEFGIKSTEFVDIVQGFGVNISSHLSGLDNAQVSDIRHKMILRKEFESENIDEYNLNSNTKIPYLDFRRNIVTEGIKLNDLLNKQITIGNIKLLGKDLCRPCKHLQELLGNNNIVKEFLLKGGLRCKIINSGTIYLNDEIKI